VEGYLRGLWRELAGEAGWADLGVVRESIEEDECARGE
jgi:hypothetical protein